MNMESSIPRPATGIIYQVSANDLEDFAVRLIAKVRAQDEERRIKEQTPPTLWTRQQAADYLNVSLQSFHNFVRRGDLEIIKVGRKTMVNADVLKEKVRTGNLRKYQHR